jgi:REP element-mobilizing transposase RayT
MPDHVHILIRKHKHQAEDMLENFQETSRLRLRNAGLRSPDHPVWGGPGWKVFLDTPTDIRRTIRYIEANPPQWRLPRQQWSFVKPYDGWPLYPGHSPNSPYAKRLREYQE